MNDGKAYQYATEKIVEFAREHRVDLVVGPEARGFIFGCPVSYALGIGFVPVRKPKNCQEKLSPMPMIWNTVPILCACIKILSKQVNEF